jgi:hypothetical protein
MKTSFEWDDLDLKPISNLPHISYVYLPERPENLFPKRLRKLPENIPYIV